MPLAHKHTEEGVQRRVSTHHLRVPPVEARALQPPQHVALHHCPVLCRPLRWEGGRRRRRRGKSSAWAWTLPTFQRADGAGKLTLW
jgi:hypothetical protein